MPAAETSQLSQLIRRSRLAAGLSQEELAERSGVSARAVSDMERGLRTAPRLETVRMLADGLELNDDDRAELIAAARPELRVESATTIPKTTTLPLRLQPLPMPLTRLVGREQEVDQITTLLAREDVRLVSLVGPGGVGKTRLCLTIADQVGSGFSDHVAFVDLSALRRPDLVASTIASELGIAVEAGSTALDALRAALRNRSLLLVLDNFEHLLEAAPIISDLLVACTGVKVLVTSRARLQLRGEHVMHVYPLEVPGQAAEGSPSSDPAANPAVRLFLDRAREADSAFSLDDRNAAAIAQICRRLDGLPLAIELAASRIAIYSPEALLDRLKHRLPALTGGARDAPARQQTLADTIAWSYDLLSPGNQLVFRRLAVFAGGFSLDAAEDVAGGPDLDVAGAIEALLDHSLLHPLTTIHGVQRFGMLETVREFAEGLFFQSEDESLTIRRRLAEWCLQLAKRSQREFVQLHNERFWYDMLDAELANMRKAVYSLLEDGDGAATLDLLLTSSFYWLDRPYYLDLRNWLESALVVGTGITDETRAHALGTLSWLSAALGDEERAASYASRQLVLAESVGTPFALGMAYTIDASVAEFSNDIERAVAMYERAAPLLREGGNEHGALAAQSEQGHKMLLLGKIDAAIAILDETLARSRQNGSATQTTNNLIHRAYGALVQDVPAMAASLFTESLDLATQTGNDRTVLGAIAGLAGVALAIDNPVRAAHLLGAVDAARQSTCIVRIFDAVHADRITAETRAHLGDDAFDALQQEGSRMTYDEAVASALSIAAEASTGSRRSTQLGPAPK